MTTNSKIPYELGSICRGVSIDKVAMMLKRDLLSKPAEPGICRFCNKDLGIKTIKIDMIAGQPPMDYPVLQCQRVADLYDKAVRLEERWQIEEAQKRADLMAQAKKKNASKQF